MTEERDTLAAELKHSEGQFAVLVGEILDQRLESIQNMVSAAVSPPASPDRKSVDTSVMVNLQPLEILADSVVLCHPVQQIFKWIESLARHLCLNPLFGLGSTTGRSLPPSFFMTCYGLSKMLCNF